MSTSCTPVLCNVLHWLPVTQRIQFKIAALTLECVRDTGSVYFSSIACTVADNSGRPGLRSAKRGDLFVLRTRATRLRRRSFFIAAPVVWNSLPLHLRSPSISHSQFWAGLMTHLFRLAFHWPFLWELLKRLNWTELMCRVGAGIDCRSITSRLSERSSPVGAWQLRRQR